MEFTIVVERSGYVPPTHLAPRLEIGGEFKGETNLATLVSPQDTKLPPTTVQHHVAR